MKYVKQILIILAFSLLGEVLQAVIPLPIPAAIITALILNSSIQHIFQC